MSHATVHEQMPLQPTSEAPIVLDLAVEEPSMPGPESDDSVPKTCSCCPKFMQMFLLYWWVVPRVQSDFWNMWYQTMTFDLFHQHPYSRMVHMRTIPANVFLTFVFFAQWVILGGSAPWIFNGAAVLAIFLSIWYLIAGLLGRAPVWGMLMMPTFLGFYVLSTMWYEMLKVPNAPWYNPVQTWANPLIWIYVSSVLQGTSHACEDLPPIVDGTTYNHWENPWVFYKKGGIWCALTGPFFMVFFWFVAYASWPHLIGSVVLMHAWANGYHQDEYEAYLRVRAKLFEHFRPENTQIGDDRYKNDMYMYLEPSYIAELMRRELAHSKEGEDTV